MFPRFGQNRNVSQNMPYFGNHFLHVASFCLFLQNRLNTHLNEHFIQSNLHFIYFPDYQYGGG